VEGNISVNTNNYDKGGRRKKADRRQFSYTFHIPERRSDLDRRNGDDRRNTGRDPDNVFLSQHERITGKPQQVSSE
jgi:hypothetical protein